MKTLALALVMMASLAAQPALAASSSILDLVSRVSNVAAAVQESASVEEPAPTMAAAPAAEKNVSEPPYEKGMITGGTINVRTGPSTNCDRITQVCTGKAVDVLDVDNGWFHIQFGETVGYVLGDYVTQYVPAAADAQTAAPAAEIPFEKGMITGGTINVRTGPSTNCDRITQVCTGKVVDVLDVDNGWFHIRFGNTVGYVLGDYIREYDPSAASSVGQQVAAMAMQYMGTRYVSGGASPGGFDCSGLTMYLYGKFGYSLPHSATSQYRNCGTHVSKSELQPGDLVFFSDSSHAIGHVGIYIGGGQIVHARYSVGRVTTNYLSESYYTNRYVGATRIAQ